MSKGLVRCYAEGRTDGRWEAICLNFDLAVQGHSFNEVYDDLNKAIEIYLASVNELPEKDKERLLKRSAPLSLQLRFLWAVIQSFFDGNGGGKERHDFMIPLPT